ncbi:GFA family protein [Acinetobacter oleivorans]|uniref:GFA family protein n=1 Tax=Acinetobacter oleivorans TaxID=1148157 RepID=UPI001901F9C4|nr:GFA family protein [Acinetobacter oleivorans]MBJ9740302.1 GFA family protein [Acinetobacter oleivorans]MCU4410219.1 GFA family protein [Acinetobacter oleivorans]
MIKGCCCCGVIKFEISTVPDMMGTCHCSRCRKLGSSTIVFIKKESFNLIQGKEFIEIYKPESPFSYVRTFCKKCGTALGEIGSENESFPVPVNCLDDDPGLRNQFHVFVSSKPVWYEIADSAPQYEENPA